MSEWTNVRIIYDISKGWWRKGEKGSIYDPDVWHVLSTKMLLETVKYHLSFDPDNDVFRLGSESSVYSEFFPFYGSSTHCGDLSLEVDDRGQLVMFGNLRDCNRKEFIRRLNIFIKTLYKYGLRIDSGLVKIT